MIWGFTRSLRSRGVDGDHNHDHAFLGEHPAVAQSAVADVADDAVDEQVAAGTWPVTARPRRRW